MSSICAKRIRPRKSYTAFFVARTSDSSAKSTDRADPASANHSSPARVLSRDPLDAPDRVEPSYSSFPTTNAGVPSMLSGRASMSCCQVRRPPKAERTEAPVLPPTPRGRGQPVCHENTGGEVALLLLAVSMAASRLGAASPAPGPRTVTPRRISQAQSAVEIGAGSPAVASFRNRAFRRLWAGDDEAQGRTPGPRVTPVRSRPGLALARRSGAGCTPRSVGARRRGSARATPSRRLCSSSCAGRPDPAGPGGAGLLPMVAGERLEDRGETGLCAAARASDPASEWLLDQDLPGPNTRPRQPARLAAGGRPLHAWIRCHQARGRGLLPWTWAFRPKRRSHNYWIITTRPDGAPPAMPVWGSGWTIGSTSLRAKDRVMSRNLAANPRCVVCNERADQATIVEGTAARVADPSLLARLAPSRETWRPRGPSFDLCLGSGN